MPRMGLQEKLKLQTSPLSAAKESERTESAAQRRFRSVPIRNVTAVTSVAAALSSMETSMMVMRSFLLAISGVGSIRPAQGPAERPR